MLWPDHVTIPTSPTTTELPPHVTKSWGVTFRSLEITSETLEIKVPTTGSVTGKPFVEQNIVSVKTDNTVFSYKDVFIWLDYMLKITSLVKVIQKLVKILPEHTMGRRCS